MLSRSGCLAYAPDGRLSGCRAVHSRRLPSVPRLRPAAPRLSSKTVGDADDRKPRSSAVSPGSRQSSKQAAAQLRDLAPKAVGLLGLLGLLHYTASHVDLALIITIVMITCYTISVSIWSPTSAARATVALKAPLQLVRFLTTVRALDLDASVGEMPQHTALQMACMTYNNERIRGLLSLGASPDIASKHLPRPLVGVSYVGDTEAVEDLLRAGANPNFLPGDLNSPLEVACREGHVEVVEALLAAGASPTAVGTMGVSPIGIACLKGNASGPERAEIVDLLLRAGADPWVTKEPPLGEPSRTEGPSGSGARRGRERVGGRRAIEMVAYNGVAEVIPVLVAAGEDPGRAPADVSGAEIEAGSPIPPLFLAVAMGHVDAVQALVAAGADIEATWGGSKELKDLLMSGREGSGGGSAGGGGGGGGWRGGVGRGITPLCFAVQEGHVDVVRALLAAGANTRVLCEDGSTLVQVAREEGMEEMVEVLLAAEAEAGAEHN